MTRIPLSVMASTIICLGMVAGYAGYSFADARTDCISNCTQEGRIQHKKCQADYDAGMIRCGQPQTNQQRNDCKKQTNEALKACNNAARAQVKQCQAACPPKEKR